MVEYLRPSAVPRIAIKANDEDCATFPIYNHYFEDCDYHDHYLVSTQYHIYTNTIN